jgi:hypothetical protein
VVACATVALEAAPARLTLAQGDTCSDQIAQLEALASQSMGNAVAKPTVPQSVDAQLHHQPTPGSVRQAEENAKWRFASILARARTLNADGRMTECIQSVAEAKRLLLIN